MKIVCHVQYLMNSISYDHEFWRTCVKWWYLQAFFLLYIFGFSRQLGREKGKKWPQMTKTFCPLHFIYQEPYIIWLSFMVHLCKMMMSPGVFFTILIPWAVRSKTRKNSVCCAPYFRNHTLHDFDLWYSCVEW